ncbi:sensor histidine kinase [Corynebacterium riegelii]|uniref:histidine kinase n=1 Tax=Corynebacterium riegelii TaxID=156976 RepID=A0A0K1RE52_9CORY|nr:HAMP domain-containing sensor histidine kinase [Corynebacterium riegelii]AKV59697.1 histidine kinase [Corynebacterium riegelii]QQU84206.1 HAMP domain-containing histidine kinase [Corynebacterium riegelii]
MILSKSYGQNTPLQKKLVTVVVAVSLLAMLLSFVTVYLLMRSLLYQRADDQLEDGLDTWVGQTAWLPSYGAPSDFHQGMLFPGYTHLWEPAYSATPPDYTQLRSFNKGQTIGSQDGADFNRQWRAMKRQEPDGTVKFVAKKLDQERRTLTALAIAETAIGALAMLGIVYVARSQVDRALKPLRVVESTALAIAAGEQSRRVPRWSRETEVGKLSYAMNTMVSQLQESVKEAEAKEEQMRRFVGDASHELRTPLTSVRGFAELYNKGMAPDADMVIRKIDEESARMQLLVEDLLALTRAEGARLNKREVDMLELTASVASSLGAAFPDRVLRINHDCSRPPVVNGDPDRLYQVLTNLITNAFKHAGPDAEVTVTLREYLDRVSIDIADNGIGMDPKDAAHIFDRFYRADTSRTRGTGGGSGLGLAITKSLIEQHDGTISVKTAPGEGSTFTISLPMPAAKPA